MTARIEDGGPAYPSTEEHPNYDFPMHYFGMSLRDYFAVHASQPGAAEIATMAGLTYSAMQIWSDASTSLGTFDKWWRDLPADERFDLCARVRYAEADAMIRARQMDLTVGRANNG